MTVVSIEYRNQDQPIVTGHYPLPKRLVFWREDNGPVTQCICKLQLYKNGNFFEKQKSYIERFNVHTYVKLGKCTIIKFNVINWEKKLINILQFLDMTIDFFFKSNNGSKFNMNIYGRIVERLRFEHFPFTVPPPLTHQPVEAHPSPFYIRISTCHYGLLTRWPNYFAHQIIYGLSIGPQH